MRLRVAPPPHTLHHYPSVGRLWGFGALLLAGADLQVWQTGRQAGARPSPGYGGYGGYGGLPGWRLVRATLHLPAAPCR